MIKPHLPFLLDFGKTFGEPRRLVINARNDYLSLSVDKAPFFVLLNTSKAFRETHCIVINARDDHLSLRVDKAPFFVLLNTSKAFREGRYPFKLLVKKESSCAIYKIPYTMGCIDRNDDDGVLALMK